MKIKVVILILICLNAAAGTYFLIAGISAPKPAGTHPIPVKCGSCEHLYTSDETDYPLACPNCGRKDVYPAYECEECEKVFNRREAVQGEDSAHLECPYCGSEAVHPLLAEPGAAVEE